LTRRKNGVESRIMDVAVNARIRRLGLTDVEAAKDPRRGYVLGRLWLAGTISEVQHEAGLRYALDLSRWFWLCLDRFPSVRAQDSGGCPARALGGLAERGAGRSGYPCPPRRSGAPARDPGRLATATPAGSSTPSGPSPCSTGPRAGQPGRFICARG
jgi:hypothetical protein